MKTLLAVFFLIALALAISAHGGTLVTCQDGVMNLHYGTIKCTDTWGSKKVEGHTITETDVVETTTIARFDSAIPKKCIWAQIQDSSSSSSSQYCRLETRGFHVREATLSVVYRRDGIPKIIIAGEEWKWAWTTKGMMSLAVSTLIVLFIAVLFANLENDY